MDIKKILNKNEVFHQAIERAQMCGVLEIYGNSIEKWNYDGSNKPKEDGSFDNEGHTWGDIFVDFKFKLKPIHIYNYLKQIVIHRDFSLTNRRWVWTFSSFDVNRWDLAEELAGDIVSIDRVELRVVKCKEKGYFKLDDYTKEEDKIMKQYRKERDNQYNLISNNKQQLIDHIKKDHSKIIDGIYIDTEDPTCIIVDEDIIPYDMKSGWSYKAQTNMIVLYLGLLGYHGFKTVLKE